MLYELNYLSVEANFGCWLILILG